MLKQIGDSYRKFRNTFRYLLGNLQDKPAPAGDIKMDDIDLWALHELSILGKKITKAYSEKEFHQVYHLALQYCTVTLSNEYFDIIRDSLYCDDTPGKRSVEPYNRRRDSTLKALQIILEHLQTWLSPILSFTTEEIQRIYHSDQSVFENRWPDASQYENEEIALRFKKILELKYQVNVKVEEMRKKQVLGSTTEAIITLPEGIDLPSSKEDLARYFIASEVTIAGEKLLVEKSNQPRCPRCWLHKPLQPSGLCSRCHEVVQP